MSNAIRFLETLGQNPNLPASELEALMATLEVDDAQRAPLLSGDVSAIKAMLGSSDLMPVLHGQVMQEFVPLQGFFGSN